MHDINQRQVVALSHLEIVRIVGGGDFDAAGAEFAIDKFIANNGDFPSQNRQGESFTN